ncbi:hypothetical protein PR202_ga13681 [Eleusine coracana subsp. coracana]|uniref:Uncharacterized protein n=1 Tax=Eleusine coracana subsp. coracana TaxID=191504 RepID=A0AAV5CEY1_ELECO|nr:hypothetical protein PR202_ga13681 [Eleusine coracana subsp. coracana]
MLILGKKLNPQQCGGMGRSAAGAEHLPTDRSRRTVVSSKPSNGNWVLKVDMGLIRLHSAESPASMPWQPRGGRGLAGAPSAR